MKDKHGWVTPLPDGAKARCGGPHMCPTCQREQAELDASKVGAGTCKTCSHWRDYYGAKVCDSEKLSQGGDCGSDGLDFQYDEGGEFYTGPDFGCVHHEVK